MPTETKNPPGEKTLSVTPTKTLTLKPRSETSVVRQSFSHGRQKNVVLEVVKRRTTAAPARVEAKPEPAPAPDRAAPARRSGGGGARGATATPTPQTAPTVAAPKSGVVLRTLTKEEQDRRAHALGDAKLREAE